MWNYLLAVDPSLAESRQIGQNLIMDADLTGLGLRP